MYVCVCVCVCDRERERERENDACDQTKKCKILAVFVQQIVSFLK